MSVKQISVFIENKKGALAEITNFISDHNINLRALSIADTQDFGILRFIADNPDMARDILKEAGYTVVATAVTAVAINDEPGSMAKILSILSDSDVVVEYAYAFTSKEFGKAFMIFRADSADKAEKCLAGNNISILDKDALK